MLIFHPFHTFSQPWTRIVSVCHKQSFWLHCAMVTHNVRGILGQGVLPV